MPFELRGGVIAPTSRTCQNCAVKENCRFNRRDMGGFKGQGPKYIGFRLICDRAENNSATQDFMTCFNFVQANMNSRMRTGRNNREDGKDGEIIRVIAQEGDTIKKRTRCGFNARNEIVRPPQEIAADLKASGFKVSTDDNTVVATWKDVQYSATVPSYAEWVLKSTGYADDIMKAEMAMEETADEIEDRAWREAEAKMKLANAQAAENEAKPKRVPA